MTLYKPENYPQSQWPLFPQCSHCDVTHSLSGHCSHNAHTVTLPTVSVATVPTILGFVQRHERYNKTQMDLCCCCFTSKRPKFIWFAKEKDFDFLNRVRLRHMQSQEEMCEQCEQKNESCVSLASSHPTECTFSMIINMMCFLSAKQVTVIFSDAGWAIHLKLGMMIKSSWCILRLQDSLYIFYLFFNKIKIKNWKNKNKKFITTTTTTTIMRNPILKVKFVFSVSFTALCSCVCFIFVIPFVGVVLFPIRLWNQHSHHQWTVELLAVQSHGPASHCERFVTVKHKWHDADKRIR